MVALDEFDLPALRPFLRSRNNRGAVGAAVDQIAKEDDGGAGGMAGRVVLFDRFNKGVEEVTAAMDVADRIDSPARGKPRGACLLRASKHVPYLLHTGRASCRARGL